MIYFSIINEHTLSSSRNVGKNLNEKNVISLEEKDLQLTYSI